MTHDNTDARQPGRPEDAQGRAGREPVEDPEDRARREFLRQWGKATITGGAAAALLLSVDARTQASGSSCNNGSGNGGEGCSPGQGGGANDDEGASGASFGGSFDTQSGF